MNRRRFLAASLRLPAAFAALPVLGGLATMAQEGEQELPDVAPAVPEMATIPAPSIDGAVRLLPDINQTLPTYNGVPTVLNLNGVAIGEITATINGVVHHIPLVG